MATAENKEERVIVAIDKDKSSQYALKWAIDHVVSAGQTVTLLHVKQKTSSIPTSAGNHVSIYDVNEDVARAFKQQIDSQAKEIFLPFRCFCTRKDIKCDEVIIEDTDISKGIIDYVAINTFEIVVVGASSRSGIVRRFKGPDIPSTVAKSAPDFCTVYTISKGKILNVRSSTRSIPTKLNSTSTQSRPPQNQITNAVPNPMLHPPPNFGNDSNYSPSMYNNNNNGGPIRGDRRFNNNEGSMDFISPFTRGKASNGRAYGELSMPPEADISFVRPIGNTPMGTEQFYPAHHPIPADRMFTPNLNNNNYNIHDSMDQFGQISRLSNASSSETMDRLSFGSERRSVDLGSLNDHFNYPTTNSSNGSGAGLSSSSMDLEEVESEMRRLKLELKQTMDMYNAACKEALTAKQKATELQVSKVEERQRLEEARLAEEAALAVAEMEKAKCKAALEAAEAAQRIAELESQKRASAENKAVKEAEEKKKALDALSVSQQSNNNGMGAGVDMRYRKYEIEEIEVATEYFSHSLKIGEGGYGPVYKCTLDHTPVAIKVLRPDAAQGQSQFQQEVEILSCIRHPNMVLLLGACPEYGCLVYEYMSNGSLEDRLFRRENTPPIPWQVRFRIAAEIGTGLLFLHQTKPEPLVHRDLKPGNILLDRNFVSKISDVGLARLVPPSVANNVTQYRMTQTAGTFCYIDPEYQQTGMLGIKSDVYSLGIILLQLVTAKPPMALTHHVERAITRGTLLELLDPSVPDWPMEQTVKFVKLALKCAEMRRKDRPDLGNVVLPELNKFWEFAEDNMPGGGSLNGNFVANPTRSSPNNSSASSGHTQISQQEVISDPQLGGSVGGSAHDSPKSTRTTSSYLSGASCSPQSQTRSSFLNSADGCL